MSDLLLTAEEVAEIMQLQPSTIYTMRNRKTGPPYVRLGHRTVRYSERALTEWLEARTTRHTAA